MYGLIWLTDLRSQMDSIDLLIMLTSAVCHDLDHTGYNNAYQVTLSKQGAFKSALICFNVEYDKINYFQLLYLLLCFVSPVL